MTPLLLLLALAQTPVFEADVFANPAPWKLEEGGALTLESRPVAGTPYAEFRVTTETATTAGELCAAVFEWGTKSSDSPGLKESRVLEDGEDQRVVYQRIEQPVVSGRDYAMTVVRRRAADGSCRIRFKATNERAPTKGEGVVRMDRLWGSWAFEPLPSGKTKLTYTLFADPAGAIPPFLVHGSQRSSAKQSVEKAIAHAKAPARTFDAGQP